MSEKKLTIWIVAGSVVIVLLATTLFFAFRKIKQATQEKNDIEELMAYEKEQLEDEYQDVALEMEGFSYKTDNDSLLEKLDQEQQRVQMLLEELRTTKATNAKRITELKKELASVRKVLVYYIAQVDSLNQINQKLTTENQQVRERYQQASQTVNQLSEQKTVLEQKMVRASQLEARNLEIKTTTDRGRKTKSVRRIDLIEVHYTILKNISTTIGKKTIYLRITTPDNMVMTKSPAQRFAFEDQELQFSSKKEFEFKGEDLTDVLYYNVNETLFPGNYRADLFVDGHLIGTANFKLEK